MDRPAGNDYIAITCNESHYIITHYSLLCGYMVRQNKINNIRVANHCETPTRACGMLRDLTSLLLVALCRSLGVASFYVQTAFSVDKPARHRVRAIDRQMNLHWYSHIQCIDRCLMLVKKSDVKGIRCEVVDMVCRSMLTILVANLANTQAGFP